MPSRDEGHVHLGGGQHLDLVGLHGLGVGGVGERRAGRRESRLALLGEELDSEAAVHLGEERVHALAAGRAAARWSCRSRWSAVPGR